MKYIKTFMLLAVAAVFTACSDDEAVYNSNEVTVGFASDTYSIRENVSYADIPITVNGLRNGRVSLTILAEEVGENPAKEYGSTSEGPGNYVITDKTLNVEADDQETRTVSVQVATIDDDDINENRTFKLTIISANGAEITTASTIVTIVDNDGALYERFAGTWYLSGIIGDGESEEPFSKKVVISGTTDETKPEYDNIFIASSTGMINVYGVDLDVSWHFRFSFDRNSKTGTLGFICGEQVASYIGLYQLYQLVWMTDDGSNPTDDDVTATWELGEDDSLPQEIVFPESSNLYLYETGAGYWKYLYNLKLTK